MYASSRRLALLTIVAVCATACSDATDPAGPRRLAPSAPSEQGGKQSGGGGSGGGGPTTAGAPAITSLVVKSGYGPYGGSDGDVQMSYTVDMARSAVAPRVHVRMSGTAFSPVLGPGTTVTYWDTYFAATSGSLRNAYLPLAMCFIVTVDLLDAAGNVLDTRTATGATPATPRLGNTAG